MTKSFLTIAVYLADKRLEPSWKLNALCTNPSSRIQKNIIKTTVDSQRPVDAVELTIPG